MVGNVPSRHRWHCVSSVSSSDLLSSPSPRRLKAYCRAQIPSVCALRLGSLLPRIPAAAFQPLRCLSLQPPT
ncbi:hypothetical protein BDV93DRAFT_529207 [Ceratobasidium sp. AG-I]|nr:hypothetical protein BDV93DRAFT_529207 [Ceratobasidium sp. AG-I]